MTGMTRWVGGRAGGSLQRACGLTASLVGLCVYLCVCGCRVVIIQDVNITQKYQELLRKLESMGGEKVGRHVVHCRLFNRKTLTGAAWIAEKGAVEAMRRWY